MSEQIFRNAAIVLRDEVVRGSLVVRDGLIAEVAAGPSAIGEDVEGDTLIPGLVELHTDHIEGHYLPRPKVRWNMMAALQAHDAQIAASGITTVFDALRVGMDEDALLASSDMLAMAETIGAAADGGRLRAAHYIHLRCEVSAPDVLDHFETFATHPRVKLVSLMDHAPGQRQFVDLDTYRSYYQRKMNLTDAAFVVFCERRVAQSEVHSEPNRRTIAGFCRDRGLAIASHDDATEAHVREGIAIGVTLAEFPTTVEAALLSRQAGLHVLMGAPNIVRGGSHSGNVSAADLLARRALDILSSDYVPFSLLQAAFLLADAGTLDLPAAIRLVATNPAAAANFADRGAITPGLRADLVRVRTDGAHPPLVAGVWREGRVSPEPSSGAFVAVVGPSGAGKDTLMSHAARHPALDARVRFARRVVTREALVASEDHDSLDEAGFARAEAQGAFSLVWGAHGLRYGLPRSVAGDLLSGRTVVANLSRRSLGDAAEAFGALHVVEVTARPEILLARLSGRGREPEATIRERLLREVPPVLPSAAASHLSIDNSGDLDAATDLLVRHLNGRGR